MCKQYVTTQRSVSSHHKPHTRPFWLPPGHWLNVRADTQIRCTQQPNDIGIMTNYYITFCMVVIRAIVSDVISETDKSVRMIATRSGAEWIAPSATYGRWSAHKKKHRASGRVVHQSQMFGLMLWNVAECSVWLKNPKVMASQFGADKCESGFQQNCQHRLSRMSTQSWRLMVMAMVLGRPKQLAGTNIYIWHLMIIIHHNRLKYSAHNWESAGLETNTIIFSFWANAMNQLR